MEGSSQISPPPSQPDNITDVEQMSSLHVEANDSDESECADVSTDGLWEHFVQELHDPYSSMGDLLKAYTDLTGRKISKTRPICNASLEELAITLALHLKAPFKSESKQASLQQKFKEL